MEIETQDEISPRQEYLRSMKKLFLSGTYSDLKIVNGPETYHVHKAVVLPRSETLNNMYLKEGAIRLKEDPTLLKLMIYYLYNLDYPHVSGNAKSGFVVDDYNGMMELNPLAPAWSYGKGSWGRDARFTWKTGHIDTKVASQIPVVTAGRDTWFIHDWEVQVAGEDHNVDERETFPSAIPQGDEPNLTIHAKVTKIADDYKLPGLKTLAMYKFASEIREHWNKPDFVEALMTIYNFDEVHPTLKEAIADTMCMHQEVMLRPEVQQVMQGNVENLAYDVLMHHVLMGRISCEGTGQLLEQAEGS